MHQIKVPKLIVTLFLVHISGISLCQDTDSLKCWSRHDKLKWDDFKGKIPDEGERSFLDARSAIQLVPLRTKRNNLLSYNIKVQFRKNKAWTTDTSRYLLSHEQLHFDISELYARKLRKAIQALPETNQNPTQEFFDALLNKLFHESGDMHAQYDEETIHGIDYKQQSDWEKKVSIELKKLEKFASTTADCQSP